MPEKEILQKLLKIASNQQKILIKLAQAESMNIDITIPLYSYIDSNPAVKSSLWNAKVESAVVSATADNRKMLDITFKVDPNNLKKLQSSPDLIEQMKNALLSILQGNKVQYSGGLSGKYVKVDYINRFKLEA